MSVDKEPSEAAVIEQGMGAVSPKTLSFDDYDNLTEDSDHDTGDDESVDDLVEEPTESYDASEEEEVIEEDNGSEEAEEDSESSSEETDDVAAENVKEFFAKTKAGKKIKASSGDSELDIPADAVIEHTVSGEKVKINVQELLNNYSGVAELNKNVQQHAETVKELEGVKQALESEKAGINEYFNGFLKAVNEGRAIEAFSDLVARTGQDPIAVRRAMRQSFLEEARQIDQLTDVEIKLLEAQEEKAYYKSQVNSSVEQQQAAAQQEALRKRAVKAMEDYGVPGVEEFQAAFQELSKHHKAGAIPEIDVIQPEDVAYYYKWKVDNAAKASGNVDTVIITALEEVNPGLKDNDEVLSILRDAVQKYDPDEATLKALIKDQWGTNGSKSKDIDSKDAAKNVNERLRSNGAFHTSNTATDEDISDFDPGTDWDSI